MKSMNDFMFSLVSRTTAVLCGAIGMGWIEMGYPKMAIAMFIVGWIDPMWTELIGKSKAKKKGKSNGQTKKRTTKNA